MTKRDKIAFAKFWDRKIQEVEKIILKERKMYDEMYDYLDYICRSVIDDFYSDYMPKGSDPIFYTRQYDLYNVYRINIVSGLWEVKYDHEFMKKKHRESNKYIYDIAFINGYHGGAVSGDGHPANGIPYWRTPFPTFDNWGRPAAISKSPYLTMEKETQDYLDMQSIRWRKEILLPLTEIAYEIRSRYNKIK